MSSGSSLPNGNETPFAVLVKWDGGQSEMPEFDSKIKDYYYRREPSLPAIVSDKGAHDLEVTPRLSNRLSLTPAALRTVDKDSLPGRSRKTLV